MTTTYKVRDITDGSPDEWSEIDATSPDLAAADMVETWVLDLECRICIRVEVLDELTSMKHTYDVTGEMVPTYWAKEVPNAHAE